VPRLAVIGFPVGHSRSPAMQTAALAELGLAEEWSYGAVEVAPEGLESKLHELAASGYAGLNVTVPHKEAALALADEANEAARAIGAANTLSFEADRSAGDDVGVRPWVIAANTDAPGLLAALPASPSGARALVLGAGGAARAAVWALVGEGAEVAPRVAPRRSAPSSAAPRWPRPSRPPTI
jgi:shikimate dehydrogenase